MEHRSDCSRCSHLTQPAQNQRMASFCRCAGRGFFHDDHARPFDRRSQCPCRRALSDQGRAQADLPGLFRRPRPEDRLQRSASGPAARSCGTGAISAQLAAGNVALYGSTGESSRARRANLHYPSPLWQPGRGAVRARVILAAWSRFFGGTGFLIRKPARMPGDYPSTEPGWSSHWPRREAVLPSFSPARRFLFPSRATFSSL